MSQYYVYILSNNSHVLYVGSTNDLIRRLEQHRRKIAPNAFTARYNFDRIVYFELHRSRATAEVRELEIKGWKRAKKVALIVAENPRWQNLVPSLHEALRLE
jgi:putative endonuclease